jgi:hypothetical protein
MWFRWSARILEQIGALSAGMIMNDKLIGGIWIVVAQNFPKETP